MIKRTLAGRNLKVSTKRQANGEHQEEIMSGTAPITFPAIRSRVWTIRGIQQHGPAEGPLVDVAPNTGGVISGIEKPYYTVDMYLYVVKWDTGQTTKHYFEEFGDPICIGPFNTLTEFESALPHAEMAEVTWGPQGGFRGFRAILRTPNGNHVIEAATSHRRMWEYLGPLLRTAGVPVAEKRIPPARRSKGKSRR